MMIVVIFFMITHYTSWIGVEYQLTSQPAIKSKEKRIPWNER